MIGYPTKSVPAGCVIGLIAVMSWIYAGICAVGVWRAMHSEALPDKEKVVHLLAWHCGVAIIFGLILFLIGWRLAGRTRPYNEWDPNEPRMKF